MSSSSMAEEWLPIDGTQYFPNCYLILIPFENQNSVVIQNTKAFINSLFITLGQSSGSLPYFLANQLFLPTFSKWGGSNTTSLKDLSKNGISVKSDTMSGWTFRFRPSQRMYSSSLMSANKAKGFFCQTKTSYCHNRHLILFLFHSFLFRFESN